MDICGSSGVRPALAPSSSSLTEPRSFHSAPSFPRSEHAPSIGALNDAISQTSITEEQLPKRPAAMSDEEYRRKAASVQIVKRYLDGVRRAHYLATLAKPLPLNEFDPVRKHLFFGFCASLPFPFSSFLNFLYLSAVGSS